MRVVRLRLLSGTLLMWREQQSKRLRLNGAISVWVLRLPLPNRLSSRCMTLMISRDLHRRHRFLPSLSIMVLVLLCARTSPLTRQLTICVSIRIRSRWPRDESRLRAMVVWRSPMRILDDRPLRNWMRISSMTVKCALTLSQAYLLVLRILGWLNTETRSSWMSPWREIHLRLFPQSKTILSNSL